MIELSSRFKKWLLNSPIRLLISSSVCSQLITLFATPFITRIYLPEQIGVVSIFISFTTLFSTFASLRYTSALLVNSDDNEMNTLFSLSLLLVLPISLLGALALYIFALNDVFGFSSLPSHATIFAFLTIFLLGLAALQRQILLRFGDFHVIAVYNSFKSVFNVSLRLLGYLSSYKLMYLIISEFIAALASCIVLLSRRISLWNQWFELKFESLKLTAWRWKRFPLLEVPSLFFDQISAAAPLFLLNTQYSPSFVGFYVIAQRIAFLPNTHLGSAISDVFQSKYSSYIRNLDFPASDQLFKRYFYRLVSTSIVLYFPLALIARYSLTFLLGEEWLEVSLIIPWIAAWSATSLVASTLSPVLNILKKQEFKYLYDIAIFSALVASFSLSSGTNYSTTIALVSMANITANLLYTVVISSLALKH